MGAPQYEQAGADIGGSGTTNTIPRWTGPSTLGDSVITQNTAANAVGVGATVNNTWAAGWRAVQVGQNAAIWADTAAIDGRFSQNVVWTGSAFNYLVNGAAVMYVQNVNGHTWSYAGAGTAGNPITFTNGMVLTSSGNVGIGTSGPQVRAHVYAANVAGKGQIMVDSPAGDISQITFYNAGTTANGALYANTSGMVLGTSSSGSLSFQQNGGTAWQIIAGRHLVAGADNTYDIGASGATRPRTVYVGTSIGIGANPTASRALTTVADLDVFGVTVGRGAGAGSANTCVGNGAMNAITTGNSSVAVGDSALGSATTGGGNTAVGSEANRYNTTGGNNTAVGYFSLRGAAGTNTGASNVAVGFQSGKSVTTGSNNLFAGYQAGANATSGNSNIVIGSGADTAAVTDSNQLVLGGATNYVATNGGATTYYATAGASLGYIQVRLNGANVKIQVFAP